MSDPKWTPERRQVLRAALRKTQAGVEQRELVKVTAEEALAVHEAAVAWADMMDHLDQLALSGQLRDLSK